MSNISNIIGAEHLAKVKDALGKVNEGLRESKLALEAGVGTQAQHDALLEMQSKLQKIKSVYFPNS